MFGKLFKKQNSEEAHFLIARINDRAQPLDRGDIYEDPLHDHIDAKKLGEVTGGGTQLSENNEIVFCELEIMVKEINDQVTGEIINKLESLGAPKGSKLVIESTDQELPFGQYEGLAIYLNGTDLDKEIYQTSDINHLVDELSKVLESEGEMHSHWQGPTETALYFYGPSFETMKTKIADLIRDYPLCQKCRLVQVA